MSSIIVIPARFGSKRLPGKPLALISGKTLLQRVYDVSAAVKVPGVDVRVVVATDDDRIQEHARELGADVVMTNPDCPTGTDRVLDAVRQLSPRSDIVINLQGDAPFTPPHFIQAMIEALANDSTADVVTPYVQLTWNELDTLRQNKQTTPFSGTTLTLDVKGYIAWLSKQIIPAIREESTLRQQSDDSPVRRHIGLYGFRYSALEKFVALPQSYYEQIDGIELLRCLENGMQVRGVQVDYQGLPAMSGVDSPEDILRAEALLEKFNR